MWLVSERLVLFQIRRSAIGFGFPSHPPVDLFRLRPSLRRVKPSAAIQPRAKRPTAAVSGFRRDAVFKFKRLAVASGCSLIRLSLAERATHHRAARPSRGPNLCRTFSRSTRCRDAKPVRGVLQGPPLSPLLSARVTETFFRGVWRFGLFFSLIHRGEQI